MNPVPVPEWEPPNLFTNPILSYPPGVKLKDVVGSDVLSYLPEHWWEFPPLNPIACYIFAVLYIVGGLIAITGNSLVLYVFFQNEVLRKPANVLVMNLAFCDLMIMILLVPESAWGFADGGTWPFGYTLCILHSFTGGLFGYGQITTLLFIAYDRYNVIVRGIGAKPLSFGRVKSILIFIYLWALFWSVGPLVGFGNYGMDGVIASCSFDYTNREPTNVKYILACFLLCFCTPLALIMHCYYGIVKAVWTHEAILREQAKKMNIVSLRSNEDAQKTSAEIRIARVSMINITLWLIAWVPFAITALIGVVGNQALLTPLVSGIPVFLSKTSCIYNPIIYAISHPKYRYCLRKSFPRLCCCIAEKEPVKYDNQSAASEQTKVSE